jgi:signal transduction histidine kinase
MSLERVSVAPRALLETVAAVMHESARARDLKVTIECRSDLAPIVIDERRIKQALCNLVSNAIKFTPEGGSITLAGGIEDGHAVMTVSDTGVGIRAEDRERVFESFERGHAAMGERSGPVRGSGAGLGLSLVKRIVELHGGRVTIDSVPDRGTTVTCTLPAQSVD